MTMNSTAPCMPAQEIVDKFVGMCHGRLDTVKSMLEEHPALIDGVSSQNESGIQAAAHMGQRPIMEFLLAQGAPMDICTASALGRAADVRRMLDADRSRKDATGAHGLPLMLYVALGGSIEIAKLMTKRGASPNGGDGIMTPLHAAVVADQPQIADWLLEHGARTDAKDFNGKTPRQAAEAMKRTRILQVFAQHEAA